MPAAHLYAVILSMASLILKVSGLLFFLLPLQYRGTFLHLIVFLLEFPIVFESTFYRFYYKYYPAY